MFVVHDFRQTRVRPGLKKTEEPFPDRSSLLGLGMGDLPGGTGIREDYTTHLPRGLPEGPAVRWPPGVDLLLELLPWDLPL